MALDLPAESGVDEIAETVALPAPTAWPIVLAFGITLIFAGLVTTASVSILGAILAVCGLSSDGFERYCRTRSMRQYRLCRERRPPSPATPT